MVSPSFEGDLAGENRLAHNLFAELKVAAGEQREPRHNVTAQKWLDFPNQPASIELFFDIRNSQELWRELATLIMRAEGDLILASAFKGLEPQQEPPFIDDAAVHNLYYIHDRKMALLNQTVYELIKVQDLVNRLLHESLGGNLVDTNKPDWEKFALTRAEVKKGLKRKLNDGLLAQTNFDAIMSALSLPENLPHANTAIAYRNRLTHHIRPSVDYSMFFSTLESRQGEEILDAQGNVVGRRHLILATYPAQYRFDDLNVAFSEYLDAVGTMLQRLSEIDILRR